MYEDLLAKLFNRLKIEVDFARVDLDQAVLMYPSMSFCGIKLACKYDHSFRLDTFGSSCSIKNTFLSNCSFITPTSAVLHLE